MYSNFKLQYHPHTYRIRHRSAVPIYSSLFPYNSSTIGVRAKGCARYRNRHRVSDTRILISLIVGASLSSTSVPKLDCESRPKGEQIPLISGRDIKVCRDNAISFVPAFLSLFHLVRMFAARRWKRQKIIKHNHGDGKSTFSCSPAERELA